MPKTLNGKRVPERYWKEAKKQARKQGFTIKDDKDKFYKTQIECNKEFKRIQLFI